MRKLEDYNGYSSESSNSTQELSSFIFQCPTTSPSLNRVKLTFLQGRALRGALPSSAPTALFIIYFPRAQASSVEPHTLSVSHCPPWNILYHSSSLSPHLYLAEELTSSTGNFPLAPWQRQVLLQGAHCTWAFQMSVRSPTRLAASWGQVVQVTVLPQL